MENYVRIILLLLGIFILIGVFWDMWRRREQASPFGQRNPLFSKKSVFQPLQQQLMSAARKISTPLRGQPATAQTNFSAAQATFANAGYRQAPTVNHQLETIMPSDPLVIKVDAAQLNASEEEMYNFVQLNMPGEDGYNAAQLDIPMEDSYDINSRHNNSYKINNIIALSVISRMPRGFPGHKLLKSFESANLKFGEMNIFHRFDDYQTSGNYTQSISSCDAAAAQTSSGAYKIVCEQRVEPVTKSQLERRRVYLGQPLFSISSAVEPGMFDLTDLSATYIPGVTLFMQLTEDKDVVRAFDLMVRTAKQLGFSLNGELRDQQQQPLTMQTIEQYRSLVMEFASEYVQQ